MTDDLRLILARFRRRLRLQEGWQLIQHTIWIPALAALLIQLAGRIWPIERLDGWSLAAFPVWLLACLGWSVFHSIPLLSVAQRVDLVVGLKERLSTALALENRPLSSDPVYIQLLHTQRQDALKAASTIDPSQALPLTWQPRNLAVAALILFGAFLAAWAFNPMDAVLAKRQAVRQEAARQAERVEQLSRQIEQAKDLSPEEREQLIRQLTELAEKLRASRGDLEQSITDLSNLEKLLTDRLDPAAEVQQANLESLAARLQAMTDLTRQPDQSAAEAAAEALAGLAAQIPSLTTEQQSELARELAQMASQASQSGDAALAQALSALAQASQTGDAQSAQQAALEAQQALAQAQSRLSDQTALQQAVEQLQSSRQVLAQAAQQAAQQAAAAQGRANSQSTGQNPGQAASQAGSGQGQPGGNVSGGGSQANALPPATGGQGNVRPRGNAANPQPGDLSNQVYAPWQRPASGNGELFIPGQETGQGETQASQGQSTLPGLDNPALVPYQQVFYNYLSAANQALGQSYIPAGLSDYVRLYFSQLNP